LSDLSIFGGASGLSPSWGGDPFFNPIFDAVVSPLFDVAFGRQIREVIDSPKDAGGMIAESENDASLGPIRNAHPARGSE
jgi:hypothetical protein